jgi:5-methyltetrahydropteroyltriglutamate--homocysteine methyltransferase
VAIPIPFLLDDSRGETDDLAYSTAAASSTPIGYGPGPPERRIEMSGETTAAAPAGQRTRPPFRADHAGSLLRPPRLLEARDAFAAGRIDAAALRGIEDDAIREVVRRQEEIGLALVTDGELRRASWHMDFIYRLDGISKAPGEITVQFFNEQGEIEFTPAAIHIDGRLGVSETIFGDDFAFLQQTVTRNVPKLTIPSPSMVHYRGGRASIDESVYPGLDGFWADLTAAYRDEVRRLGEQGCTYLQFDDTSLAYLNDPHQREYVASIGGDPDRQHVEYIHHINEALSARPAGMAVTTHMCRGNFRSSWAAEGGYEFVAEALFNELEVDGFFMEWDDERSGGFAPLRFVPKGKLVVLGLVTTKRGELEAKDELKRRIDEASRFVDVDQLCLSPQCGFSSTVEGNLLSYDDQVAKLRLVVETANEVWG